MRGDTSLGPIRQVASRLADHEWLILLPSAAGLLLMGRVPLAWITATLVLIPVPWLCRRVAYGYFSRRTPLDFPILLFLLMHVQGLYPSADLHRSLSVLVQDVIQVALFYAVVNGLTSRYRTGIAAGGLLLAGTVVATGSLWNTQWPEAKLFALPQVYDALARLQLPWFSARMFDPNFIGAALAMLSPLAVALVWSRLEFRWRALAGISLLIMLPVLLLTQSRGALIGLAAALVLIGGHRSRVVRWVSPAGLLVGVLMVNRVGLDQVAGLVLVSDATATVQSRLEVWSRALYMIQDFPYTGIGPGTYGIVAPILYPFFVLGPDTLVAHPHNIYLGAAVDLGLPGLVAFIAVITAWLLVAITGLRRARGMWSEPLFVGLLGGFIVYLVHGLFDQVTFSTKTGAALWIMMGMVMAMWVGLPDSIAAKREAVIRHVRLPDTLAGDTRPVQR